MNYQLDALTGAATDTAKATTRLLTVLTTLAQAKIVEQEYRNRNNYYRA